MDIETTINSQMERIKAARAKAEKIASDRNRLQGEIDSLTKQIAELEEECRQKYKCEISQLPSLMDKITSTAEAHLAEAEKILSPQISSSSISSEVSIEGLL